MLIYIIWLIIKQRISGSYAWLYVWMVSTYCNFIRHIPHAGLDYTSNVLIFFVENKLQDVIAAHRVFRSPLKLDAPLSIWGPKTQRYRHEYGSRKWRFLLNLAPCEIHLHSLLESTIESSVVNCIRYTFYLVFPRELMTHWMYFNVTLKMRPLQDISFRLCLLLTGCLL